MDFSKMPDMPLMGGPAGGPPIGGGIPMADINWVKRKFLDVPYAHASAAQCLDLYLPDTGSGPFPLLIHIHGGAFAFGDKRDDHMNAYLKALKEDFAVASVEYRFSGEAIFPAAVLDCRAAVRYLKSHAREYGVDAEKIAVIGGSAGGNLAAMLGMNVPNGAFPGEAGNEALGCEPFVQVAVDQFGPVRFETMQRQAEENGIAHVPPSACMPEARYLGTPPDKAPQELLAAAYPGTYASDAMAPLLVQHGAMDHLVPFEQSSEFVEDLCERGFGGKVTFVPLANADHEDPGFFAPDNMRLVLEFIKKHL